MTIWFDVDDLLQYFRVGNKRISGIQRLSFEVFRAAVALSAAGEGPAIGFVRHGARQPALIPVAWADLLADFGGEAPAVARPVLAEAAAALPQPPPAPKSRPRRWARAAVDRLPPEVRRPLVLAGVMQLQAGLALAQFGAQAAFYPARAGLRGSRALAARTRRPPPAALSRPAPGSFDALAQPGDTLLVLGAPWNRERFSDTVRHLRDEKRMRFGVLVHDLVPIRHPEWCHRGVPKMFREWYADLLPFCDVVFANSRHTAADVAAYARESGMVLNGPVQPLPVGSGFAAGARADGAGLPAPGSYVLFVSTLEARKNHALLIRVWSVLLDEVRAGRRDPASVPDLVFAGRVGWLVADLLAQLDNTGWLGSRVRLIQDPTDAELRALYAGCLFTVFPSWHEGWGLPVTESLAAGKPCICSDAASLPEAGGALCRYFDPGSLRSALAAISAVLDDRGALAAWEAEVRTNFRLSPWADTFRAILGAVDNLEFVAEEPSTPI